MKPVKSFCYIAVLACILPVSSAVASEARGRHVENVLGAIETLCSVEDLSGLAAQAAIPGSWLLSEERLPNASNPRVVSVRLVTPDLNELEIERRQHLGQLRQFRVSLWLESGE